MCFQKIAEMLDAKAKEIKNNYCAKAPKKKTNNKKSVKNKRKN